MKSSTFILKTLLVLLLFAVATPIAAEFIQSGQTPELISIAGAGGASLMFAAFGAPAKTSLEIKEQRYAIHQELDSMNEKAKKEKRDFTADELKIYNDKNTEFKNLGRELLLAEENEGRSMEDVLKKFTNGLRGAENNAAGEAWYDLRSGEKIPVFGKGESLAASATKEQRSFSLGKAVQAIIAGDWRNAPNEQRALSTSVGSGAVMVPVSLLPEVIDTIRDKAVIFIGGAKVFAMKSETVVIAKITGEPTVQVKEQNAAFDEGIVSLDALSMKAFTIGTMVYMSRELAQDAPNAANAITSAIVKAVAAKVDHMALYGQGTSEPLGVLNLVGTEVIDLDSAAALGYDDLIQAWTQLAENNAEPSAYVVSPRDRGNLAKTKAANGYLVPPTMLDGKILHTSSVPTNLGVTQDESVAIAGDFSKMLVGIRDVITIEVSTEAGDAFKKHQIAIKVTARVDVGFEHANHFAKIVNISAPA